MNTFLSNNPLVALLIPAGIGILALAVSGYLLLVLRRLRQDQRIVMGDEGQGRDLIAHSHAMQQRVDGMAHELRQLRERLEKEGRRVDDCFTFRSVIRYDAYRDLSGMQSTSTCLLDSQFSGIIVSSIQSRDHARIYVKEVRHGDSKEKLSPEEIQVLKEAMGLKPSRPRQAAKGGRIA